MLMKTFLSQVYQAFVRSRELQAERIRQSHGYVWVARERDPCLPIEMTREAASGRAEAPAEFKLAA
jgi:hypothetical protein